MKNIETSALALFTPLICLAAMSVAAEEVTYKPETVTSKFREEVAPLGARAGAFRLYPSLSLSEKYHDNIFATNTNEESDFITEIKPAINIESLWGRHFLALHADAAIGRYDDNDSENYEDYSAGFDGNIEISHAQNLSGGYEFSHEHEQRYSPDDVLGVEPTELDANSLYATYKHQFNRISVEVGGEYQTLDYDDVRSVSGLIIDNDDRDRDRRELSIKLGYDYLPEYTAYVRTTFNDVNYDDALDGNGFNRDSDGYSVSVGSDLDLSGVLYGNIFVGYESQEYDDAALKDVDGLMGGASLTWLPSQMTTVTGSITRSIEETTLNSASGIFSTEARLVVDHELLRNLLLQARLSVADDNFEGLDRNDDYFSTGIGATYMLNRHFYIMMDYDHSQRDSDSVTNINDFSEDIFSLGGRIQL